MIGILQPFFLFYAIILIIWLRRAQQALRTLDAAPRVRPEPPAKHLPKATIIVPAKNEEKNIQSCLETLLAQDYPDYEVIVVNDNSTDQTGPILQSFQSKSANLSPRLICINASPTPPGWTGKNWALHQALPKSSGDWLLFTDADTRHNPQSLSSAVAYAAGRDLKLLTLTPRCLARGFWEKTIQPSAMGFTGLWFPLEKVNDPDDTLYFGNGQYLLIHKGLYRKTGGHEAARGEFLEDFALFKTAKDMKEGVCCAIGTTIYGTRMYDSLKNIWRGWRRIYLHAFNRRPVLLLKKAADVFIFSTLPFILFPLLTFLAYQNPELYGPAWGFSIPSLLFIFGTLWKTHGIIHSPKPYAVFHPLAAAVLTGILLDAARMAFTKQQTVWR